MQKPPASFLQQSTGHFLDLSLSYDHLHADYIMHPLTYFTPARIVRFVKKDLQKNSRMILQVS